MFNQAVLEGSKLIHTELLVTSSGVRWSLDTLMLAHNTESAAVDKPASRTNNLTTRYGKPCLCLPAIKQNEQQRIHTLDLKLIAVARVETLKYIYKHK